MGMFFAAMAFIAAALVQIQIDVSVTHIKTHIGQHTLPHEAQFTIPFPF